MTDRQVTQQASSLHPWTPGPWLYRTKSCSFHTAPDPGTEYTYGEQIFAFEEGEAFSAEPHDADLALIALAPEMAEAIRALDHAWGFEDTAAEQAAEAALVSVSQKLHAIGGGPDAG